jgi:hypothetical protein
MTVIDWLLDSDPSIRWQVMRRSSSRDAPTILIAAAVPAIRAAWVDPIGALRTD